MINGSIGKILVVDDEVELKNVLVEALTSQGYQAAGFTSGEEALEVLRGKAFDVLLTDLMMPGIDGITLVREGLQIDPHLVCIVMTGQGTIQTAVDAMKEGAFDYVLKPFRLQTVLPVLTRAMNTRHLRLENLQLRETVAIYELGQTIAFTLDAQTVISKLADAALQQTDADEVSVLLPPSDGSDELYVAAVRGENRKRLLGERVPLDESISGWVARERESLILDGAINDKRFRSLWPHPEIRSAISIPMQVAGKLVGTININALSRPRPFTLGQLKALTILASTAAAALESAALYAQVQRAEENYRSIFENAIDGIFRATPDAVRFISVNPFMAQMFGYESPAEMVQVVEDMTEQIGLDPASRDEARDLLEKHGVLENFETHVRRKDGSEIWVSSNIRAICDAEGKIAYLDGIVQDVTERKLAEEERKKLAAEVEKQRERLDNIVSTVPGVVWEAWGEPDTATQRINFVSDYVETMLGYSVEEWLSTPNFWLSIVHPDDKEVAARVAGESFATGKTSPQEFRWMTKDGRALWVESNYAVIKDDEGQPIGLRGVNTDISERKMAETALHESEERYRALVESLPVMIYYARADPPYSPLYLNSNIEALGYSTDEWYAKPDLWVSLLHPDDREWVLRATEAARTAGTETEYEYRVVAKDGSIRWLHDRGRFFTNASGVRTWQGVILDVTERRLSEEALRESEQRYRDLVENSHEIICTHDLEGKILSLNRAALQLLGYEPSDFVDKKTIQDILAPEVRDQFDDYMKEVLEKRASTSLMLVQTRSGERRVLEYYNSLRTEGVASPIVRAIARDITERRQAERALRESEERYRDLVENAHDIIFSHDLNGNYTSVSRAGEQITGYTHDECLALNIIDTIAPEHVKKAREMVAKKLAGEKVTAYEVDILAKDGKRIAVEVNTKLIFEDGVPVGVQGIARDITERKLAQAELTRLAMAVEQTADSILITDTSGNIEYVNPAFERITGYSKEEALGQNPRILKSGQTAAPVYSDLWQTITRGEVWKGELVNRKKDGTIFYERATISAVRDEAGKVAHYLAVKQDITHEIRLEEQLRQSQKMEAIGQLAGGVAHDFNNLLTAINGYSSLALQRIDDSNTVIKGYLEEIRKAGDRAANLTRQLLAFGRKQILQPLPINLNDVVGDMNKMLRRLIGEDVTLIAKVDSALKKIQADPGQIEQVLVNLVVNARDAMPQGGTLTIESSMVELDYEYAAKRLGVKPGTYVMLAVSDTGTGMDDETRARIFDPFFTTKEKGKGTGLGLSTVYGIVKQSGGNIWVYSELGRGTTFKVYLPQIEGVITPSEKAKIDVSIPRGSETILLVEDEDVVRGLTQQVLEQAGYKVVASARGEEAIRLYSDGDRPIDLLLTDVVMPETSGKEVADRLTALTPGLKVLFMSGYTDEAIVHHGVLDSNIEFIQKPFTPAALARKVREVLDANANGRKKGEVHDT